MAKFKPWELPDQVRESLKQIDSNSWLIADKFILRRTASASDSASLWQTADGSHFSFSEVSFPLPPVNPLPADGPIKLIHDVGFRSAVYDLGDAILKVKLDDEGGTTKEVTTLNWLSEQNLTFSSPKVLWHLKTNDRYYLIISRVPGETLGKLWPQLDDKLRREVANRVADIIEELGNWQNTSITGIDGKHLAECYMDVSSGRAQEHNFSPEALKKNCEALGMDCSTFIFAHCDLGPYNLLFDLQENTISVIDWEIAGFVPRDWIRTKTRVSPGLDLDYNKEDFPDPETLHIKSTEWRALLDKVLAERGYQEFASTFMAWVESVN